MTAKIETEFIFETNIYFTSAQKTVTFLAISKSLEYPTLDEIRWNPELCRCQQAYEPLKHSLWDTTGEAGAVQFLCQLFIWEWISLFDFAAYFLPLLLIITEI